MFCKKCGLKIEAGDSRCRQCGEPVSTAEYCGGFWEITRIDREIGREADAGEDSRLSTEDLSRYRDFMQAAEKKSERLTEEYREEIEELLEDRRRLKASCRKAKTAAAVLGILVVLLLIFSIGGLVKKHDLEKQLHATEKQLHSTEKKLQEYENEEMTGE